MVKSIHKQLLTYSYNIVGSYEDAKDLVQDAIEKYIILDKSHIQNETNYLIKSVINHSINFKQRKARAARYGTWLPEPVVLESADSRLIRENTAGYTLLVLMEKLNARERAVFILREAFDYSHDEIADVLDITNDNVRQIYVRAKRTLRVPWSANGNIKRGALDEYINAIVNGDVKKLEKLLADDVRVYADGGTKVKVVADFVTGAREAIQLLLFVYRCYKQNYTRKQMVINNQPALCFYDKKRLIVCQVFGLSGSKIANVYTIMDATKLKNIDF